MRRLRSGIGAELAPLVLILACLAGSFGLIIATYRRANAPKVAATRPPVVAIAPLPEPVAPAPKPIPTPAPVVAEAPKLPAPEPAPPPEDPTPKALAALASAEAEQLLEASRANRKAQALEEARLAALAESERWRRRQSLIHSQLGTLEGKVRKVEVDLDAMALERDALEREIDARKAAIARAKSRPGQAILPHKGPNGTWRRPVVVECRNGAAVIQPQGAEFGLYELEAGFGSTNKFVAAVAREAIRVQRQASPDGAPVVPYIFFLVRPDGIRPYYEARGRLEPLGITFGYELADADWEIEFPDLDDLATWDGSAPATGKTPVLSGGTGRPGGGNSAEDVDLPTWPGPRGPGTGPGGDGRSPFTFGGGGGPGSRGVSRGARPPAYMGRPAGNGLSPGGGVYPSPGDGASRVNPGGDPASGSRGDDTLAVGPPPPGFPAALLAGTEGSDAATGAERAAPTGGPEVTRTGGNRPSPAVGPRVLAGGRLVSTGPGTSLGAAGTASTLALAGPDRAGGTPQPTPNPPGTPAQPAPAAGAGDKAPFELALDGPTADEPAAGSAPDPIKPLGRAGRAGAPPTELALGAPIPAAAATPRPPGTDAGEPPDAADPGSTFVWNGSDGKPRPTVETPGDPTLPPLGAGNDEPAAPGSGAAGAARPGGARSSGGGNQAAKLAIGQPSGSGQPSSTASPDQPPPAEAMGIAMNTPPLPSPSSLPTNPPPPSIPPLAMNLPIPRGLPSPTEAAAAVSRQTNARPDLADFVPAGSVVDKSFEIVVVCSLEGVIVQPGNYRVTADALRDREGLFKKQVVALVKNRRAADPTTQVEPRVRFLVQPRGFETYRMARSQFFVSGLTWPTSTQFADPDPLVIQTRGDR